MLFGLLQRVFAALLFCLVFDMFAWFVSYCLLIPVFGGSSYFV